MQIWRYFYFAMLFPIGVTSASDYRDWKAPPPELPVKHLRLISGKTYVTIKGRPKLDAILIDLDILERHRIPSGSALPLTQVITLFQEQHDKKRQGGRNGLR